MAGASWIVAVALAQDVEKGTRRIGGKRLFNSVHAL